MEELIDGFTAAGRFGYEETAYLLMFGGLPTAEELEQFKNILSFFREQPPVGTTVSYTHLTLPTT